MKEQRNGKGRLLKGHVALSPKSVDYTKELQKIAKRRFREMKKEGKK